MVMREAYYIGILTYGFLLYLALDIQTLSIVLRNITTYRIKRRSVSASDTAKTSEFRGQLLL